MAAAAVESRKQSQAATSVTDNSNSDKNLKKRNSLTVGQKLDIIARYDELSVSQHIAAEKMGITQGTLCRLLQQRTQLQKFHDTNYNQERKRFRYGKDEIVEKSLLNWVEQAKLLNEPISSQILKQKAAEIALKLGRKNFKVSNGWFCRWKKRANINFGKTNDTENKNTTLTVTKDWVSQVLYGYEPHEIWNADEVALYYRMLPSGTKIPEESQRSINDRVTLLACVSMTGEKRPLFMIGQQKRPSCFKGLVKLPMKYVGNIHSWMTSTLFVNWLKEWDSELMAEGRRALLILDSCAAHPANVYLDRIRLVFIPSTIPAVHPCYLGVTRQLKAKYRLEIQYRVLDRINADNQLSSAIELMKKITILDAMHMLVMAWNSVSSSYIADRFMKCGLTTENFFHVQHELIDDEIENPSFTEWIDLDKGVQAREQAPEDEIVNGLFGEIESESDYPMIEDEDEEPTPSAAETREMLRRVRLAVERRGYEDYTAFHSFELSVEAVLRKNVKLRTFN